MKIYKVIIICSEFCENGYDVPYYSDTTEYMDYFPTEEIAIKKAEEQFKKYGLNDYVESVNARIYECGVTADGMKTGNRIFNLYKHN